MQKLKMLGKEVDERLLVEKFADFQLELKQMVKCQNL